MGEILRVGHLLRGGGEWIGGLPYATFLCGKSMRTLGNGPNTVSGSTVSNTELSEFFGAH